MSWSAPKTWTAGAVLTAAEMNQYVRDNFLETCPATAQAAGDLIYADAANSMGGRLAIGSVNSHLVSTGSVPVWRQMGNDGSTGTHTSTSTSYIPLSAWSPGDAVVVTLTAGVGKALVLMTARVWNSAAGSSVFLGFEVSGATTLAFSDNRAGRYESSNANDVANPAVVEVVSLAAGSNTFTAGARVDGGTGSIDKVDMVVIPWA